MQIYKDLQVIAAFVILTAIFTLLPPLNTTPLRAILGIPMILFLPGYALIAALFPGKSDLDGIERLALSFGLSIAVVPLLGLGLNFTPFGIRLIPILFSLSIFTLAMCALAHFRRMKLPENERFAVPFSNMRSALKQISDSKSRIDKILTVILLLSIFASIAMLIYVIVTPKQGEKFTEFYILGEGGRAEGYPTALKANETGKVIAGIVNHEYALMNYTLQLSLDGEILSQRDVALEHNATWEQMIEFTAPKSGKLEFLLYREANFTAPYRSLHLWITVTS